MVPPLTVNVDVPLDELQDLFDKHPFHGIPVVEEDGKLVGAVSRAAVGEAALERAESDCLKRQRTGDELRSMPPCCTSGDLPIVFLKQTSKKPIDC
jgi:magnesium transporter